MTPANDELDDEILFPLVDITLQAGRLSFSEQKRAYQAWLDKYIPLALARGLTTYPVKMRRLVAGWLLREAAVARRPARAFEPLLRDIEALGWDSLQQKAPRMGNMCSYFAKRMWKREGMRYLLPLQREVEQELARTGDRRWELQLRFLGEIEARLRARRRPW